MNYETRLNLQPALKKAPSKVTQIIKLTRELFAMSRIVRGFWCSTDLIGLRENGTEEDRHHDC